MNKRVVLAGLLVLVLTLFAFPIPSIAATIYYVSPTGDNGTGGDGSYSLPWQTISYAVGQASNGDIIKVMDDDDVDTDDYVENITVDKPLTIERYDDTGTNPQVKAENDFYPVILITSSDVTIRGLDVYGTTLSYGWYAGIYLNGEDFDVTGCTIENNRCGWDVDHKNLIGIYLYGEGAYSNTIQNNECINNSYSGIELNWSSESNQILNNTCSNNGTGIYLMDSCNSNNISGNSCLSNNHNGIYVQGSNLNTIHGNTCDGGVNKWQNGIQLDSATENNISGNTCMNNAYGIHVMGDGEGGEGEGMALLMVMGDEDDEGNAIVGNTCSSNEWAGIHVDYTGGNEIWNTICSDNMTGIELCGSENNNIHNNTFVSNTYCGFLCLGAFYSKYYRK